VLILLRLPEPALLESAVRAAVAQIGAVDAGSDSAPALSPGDHVGPAYVSEPVAVPDGWLVMIDFDSLPPAVRREAVERLVARVEAAAGQTDVEIGPAPTISHRYQTVFDFSPVARALLRGQQGPGGRSPGTPPPELTRIALGWLRERAPASNDPITMVMSVEVPSPWQRIPGLIETILPSAGMLTVISTDFASAQASLTFGAFQGAGVALCASGTSGGAVAATLATEMRHQRDAIRANVDALSWAGVLVESNGQIIVSPATEPYDAPEPYPMWFQVLTTAQVRHLGGPPPDSVPLPDGRAELTVGEPEQWLPDHPDRDDVKDRARTLLTPPADR
jgi:hypothetical protein